MYKPEKALPKVEYVENVLIIWLNQSMSNRLTHEISINQLKQVANVIKIFSDAEECETFIHTVKDEKLLVILSGNIDKNFVSTVHSAKQLELIYIFSPGRAKVESWFSQYSEIQGIYTTMTSLCEQLTKDIKKINYDLIGFTVMEGSVPNTTSKSNPQDATFMYDHLFRNIVLTIPDENMQDMFEFCEQQYRGNVQEEKFIKIIKTKYTSHTPVWWYSQEMFLYRMMNKALRTHQYDLLYLLRVFIRHLHQEITTQQKCQSIVLKTLFRGQGMDKDDFERLRTNEGGLVSISNFFSTSVNRDAALCRAREARKNKKKVSILMEIKINGNTTIPVANMTGANPHSKEEEWLFSTGSIFRVGSLKRLPDRIWVVPLILTDNEDEQLDALKDYFKKTMADRNICLNFGSLMYQLASWSKSEYFFLKALESETTWQRRSVLLNNIGLAKEELGKPDEALACYFKSLELKLNAADSDNTADIASTYNNIATLYHGQKIIDRAMEYYEKAIEASSIAGYKNEGLVATLNTNVATILTSQGKYAEALEKCKKALAIRLKTLPAIHPAIATTYAIIANIMYNMGSHVKAIEYIQKAIDIDQLALPSDHPQLILHTNNLSIYKQHLSNS